jgi:hypothetical protein
MSKSSVMRRLPFPHHKRDKNIVVNEISGLLMDVCTGLQHLLEYILAPVHWCTILGEFDHHYGIQHTLVPRKFFHYLANDEVARTMDLWIINGIYQSAMTSPTSSIELIEVEHTLFPAMLPRPLEVI